MNPHTSDSGLQARALAESLIALELRELDLQAWDAWLAHYHPEVEYWVPAWQRGVRHTQDPQRELSLIYCPSRQGLEERVLRLRSQRSPASTPLRRTAHAVSNVLGHWADDQTLQATAVFHTHTYDWVEKREHVFFGLSEYAFITTAGHWQIRRKKQVLMNDALPGMLDFYWL